MGEKPLDLGRAHIRRMAFPVKEDKAANPTNISRFRTNTVVPNPRLFPDTIKQAGFIGHEIFLFIIDIYRP
jgi:hypothetical protein